jgi:integrase
LSDATDILLRLAANPRAAAALSRLVTLAGQERSAQDAGVSDNSIAAGSGSSTTTTEEPMYQWTSTKPYPHHEKWRVWFKNLDGTKGYQTFDAEDEAWKFVTRARRRILKDGGHKPLETIEEYLQERVAELRPSTISTVRYRLKAIFRGREKVPIEAFPWMKAWTEQIATQSVDTQHGTRWAAQGFAEYCVRQGILRQSPLADLEIKGKKRTGKEQLRIDEARRFVGKAFAHADDPLALACATMLLTGLRPGEVMNLRVRDCDDGGAILWVEAGKTEAARRRVEVAEELRPHLLAIAAERQSLDYLFELRPRRRRAGQNPKARTDALLRRVRSLCQEANVPKVCAHSMRGLHSTLATAAGTTGHAVARALGHTSFAVTKRHYVQREVLETAQRSASLAALRGRNMPVTDRESTPKGLPETEFSTPSPDPRNTKTPAFTGVPECEEGESNPHGC